MSWQAINKKIMDLEPLLIHNVHPSKRRIPRRNSGTFRSLSRNRCFMLFLFGLLFSVVLLLIYYNPDVWFNQHPSYTIGELHHGLTTNREWTAKWSLKFLTLKASEISNSWIKYTPNWNIFLVLWDLWKKL